MDVTTPPYSRELAAFAADATLTSIPQTVLELLPVYILDSCSSMLAGTVQPIFHSCVETVKITYGIGMGSTSVKAIDGTNTSLSGAIFLNGVSAGDFEFEHVIQNAHPASAMLPALLTVASTYRKTGEELLTAMAVGYEIACRVGFACTAETESVRGFHNPGVNGSIATAAAIGCLMRWNADVIASAMGVAASSSAGLMAFVNTGAMTKRIHPARAAQLGAEAVFLAHSGVAGPANVLENPKGFLNAFSPDPQPAILTKDLGNDWMATKMILKLSPVHAYAQTFVYAVNQYRTTTGQFWDAQDIESVIVYCGPGPSAASHRIVQPDSLVSAQYSVPFAIAAALVVDLTNPLMMNDALLANQAVQSISALIQFVQNTNDTKALGGVIEVCARGEVTTITADGYPGLPGDPCYVKVAQEKYTRVIRALNVEQEGKALQKEVENVASSEDLSSLVEALVIAGKSSKSGNLA